MKLLFTPNVVDVVRTYCIDCQHETVTLVAANTYHCDTCHRTNPRAIIIDPQVEWWTDTGEYWHATAGIFVVNELREFLFFDRTKFPFGLTVPAGHVDIGESALSAAHRELGEETQLSVDTDELILIGSDPLVGDGCRRGSDAHRWHSFLVHKPVDQAVVIDASEGHTPVWITLEAALKSPLTFATRQVILRHRRRLEML